MKLILAMGLLSAVAASGADEFFSSKIEPILKARCYECHSHAKKMKGGLTLDSKSGWEQGGDSGTALVPEDPDKSLLIKMVRWVDEDHQMPPKEKMPAAEIALLEEWVKRGAPDPRIQLLKRPNSENWWSLKPLVKPPVPDLGDKSVQHPIDRFIGAKLAEKKLTPSPPADARTLLRRISYDLHGLPPSPSEVEAFAKDATPGAYDRLVETLLESPRFGERWARHWLDTVHFAETHGCGHDLPRDHAWRYRDYVIDSFNQDKPWPRFIREQLAVDRFFPEDTQLTPALGFLGAGLFDHSAFQTAPINFDYLDRDDLVMQTMGAFVSTTAQCARCHAHKFDPITQADYYAVQSSFSGVIEGNISFDADPQVAKQRKAWLGLLAAAEAEDKKTLLQAENEKLVGEWEGNRGPAVKWTTFGYESFVSTEGSQLARAADALLSSGARPDKDTYIITGTAALAKITAIRIEVLADKAQPKDGPGRQDNGNLTLSEFDAQVFDPGVPQPAKLKFSRATADFNQANYAAKHAIDGNPATGWGIFPAVGQTHQAVFELAEPLVLKPGARLTLSLKQLAGRSHLLGRFSISVTDDSPARAAAMPALAIQALGLPVGQRSDTQRLALASYALRIRAAEELSQLPEQVQVYAAARKADVLLAVGKGTPTTVAKPKKVQILQRGDFDKPVADAVSGGLSVLTELPSRFIKEHAGDESERRAALADWLADEKNPLTWRSIANRVWHYHFGRGICDSPNDFGRMGGLPSHVELLDWLACELREHNGSLKHLHRLIVTSAAYRQASEHRDDAALVDADNRLLWRMNRLRLDADSYRDFVVSTAGKLDLTVGGPSVRQFITGRPLQLTPTLDYPAYNWAALERHRRSIYRFVWRGVPDPFMDALDFPDLGMPAPVRGFSASALQSLALYNNAFVLHFSGVLAAETPTPKEVFHRILLREPSAEELRNSTAYADKHGIAALCRVLLNSNEFLFVN
jgi:hypothetical protein